MRTVVIAGHDSCGFDRFAILPAGSTATLASACATWTYRVDAGYLAEGTGVPAAGPYRGDLLLQPCVEPDTGFSYLMRPVRVRLRRAVVGVPSSRAVVRGPLLSRG